MTRRRGSRLPLAVGVLLAGFAAARSVGAQERALPLPLPTGAAVVQALSFTGGDRESVHTVSEASAAGLSWTWELVEVHAADTVVDTLTYFERATDVEEASRLWLWHGDDAREHPGYTMNSVSRAVYRRLRAGASDSFQVMALETPTGGAALATLGLGRRRDVPVRWRGTVSLLTPAPVSFPLLVNGRRVTVPALRVRGSFTARAKRWEPEMWILADSTYPLLLKWIGSFAETGNVLQTVRVDLPAAASGSNRESLENELTSSCRVELPGIYFAFNSAALNPSSDRAITALAEILARHPDWTATLEGHTDSIGSAAANRALSQRRVEVVRERLVSAHKVDGTRLRAIGHGSSNPKETNATVEGRARNRRVELVRECAAR